MRPDLARRLTHLEATRALALEALAEADPAALNRAPGPGRWSALQVLHHVVTAEALTVGYIRKKMRAGAALPRSGLVSRLRLLLLQFILGTPLRFRAPAATGNVPEAIDATELRARWEEVRRDLAALLAGFPEELMSRLVFRHPFVGLMGIRDTCGFLQAHLEHHLRQVEASLSRPR